jgi:hypothetical protein
MFLEALIRHSIKSKTPSGPSGDGPSPPGGRKNHFSKGISIKSGNVSPLRGEHKGGKKIKLLIL